MSHNHMKQRAEYIWLDSNNKFRSKTKTFLNKNILDPPTWTYDGSSTGQAEGKDSEVILVPVKMCRDPFRKSQHNMLILCDIILPGETKSKSNRQKAKLLCDKYKDKSPQFAFEQEYTFLNRDRTPLGFQKDEKTLPQGPYYCGIGCKNAYGREIVEDHYDACLFSGLDISGINAEVMPGQWEYQVHATGIDSADQLLLARYIMERICEKYQVIPSLDPKPCQDWNGAGCHTNFSSEEMRRENGYQHILKAIQKLSLHHSEHIEVYGKNNDKRLTGDYETSSITKFSSGVADRGASIRIPRMTFMNKCGYLEDRRPASNCDPYQVIWRILKTVYDN